MILTAFYETEWFGIIMISLATAIAGLITWAFTMFKAWLNKKIKDEHLKSVMIAAATVIENATLAIQQTFVDQLKKDGKFDPEKHAEALAKAVDTSIKMLSQDMQKVIEENFGDLEHWVTVQIESILLKFKK